MESEMADESTDAGNVVDTSNDPAPAVAEAEQVVSEPEAYSEENPQVESDEIVDLDTAEESQETQAEVTEEVGETEESEDTESEETAAPEMLEFNFGGNKLLVDKNQIPVELAGKVQEFVDGTYADYTRKAQTNAERAKSLEAGKASLETMANLNGEILTTYSQGLQLRAEIDELSRVDTGLLWQSQDPADHDTARRVSDSISQKTSEFNTIIDKVGEHETALTQAQSLDNERLMVEGKTKMNHQIKDFSTKHAPDLVKYAMEMGMDEQTANAWPLNPVFTTMAYESMLYRRIQAAAKKPGRPTVIPAKPVAPIRAASATTSTNDPDRMGMEQLGKYLELQP